MFFNRVREDSDVKEPRRATKGSAGYDFFAPEDIEFKAGEYKTIATGIYFKTDENEKVFLMCVPRSGLGFKHGEFLRNSVGIIDSDYWQSDNNGEIFAKIKFDEDKLIKKGEAFMQGIIVPYLTVCDDDATEERNGGFGSTDGK